MHVELAVGVGQREHGLLDGGVGGLALRQDAPGNQRPVELLGGGVGPPGAKQRQVGEGPLETDAVEGALGRPERRRLEEQRAEDQVGLVADREGGGIATLYPTGPVQLPESFLGPAVPQQRDAEVVGGEAFQVFGAL